MEPTDNVNRLKNSLKNNENQDATKVNKKGKVEMFKNKRANPSLSASDSSEDEVERVQNNESHKKMKYQNESDFINVNFKLTEEDEDKETSNNTTSLDLDIELDNTCDKSTTTTTLSSLDDKYKYKDKDKDKEIITKSSPSTNNSEDFMTVGTQKENINQLQLQMPNLKIQPIFGGSQISFPVHPRLTLIDLKDFILFNLNIPHPQQILSFYSGTTIVILSSFSENTILCKVPGLIDEITGRCAPVMLSFKMSSGMDFGVFPTEADYEKSGGFGEYFSLCTTNLSDNNEENNIEEDEGFFEIPKDDKTDAKVNSLVSSLISLIPLPPGVNKSSKMLIRSLSKASPLNNNLPTLWEIYFPAHEIKMLVTAVINVNDITSESPVDTDQIHVDQGIKEEVEVPIELKSSSSLSPTIVITGEEGINTKGSEEATEKVINTLDSLKITTSPSSSINELKFNCEKCRIRCRPALRFMCKCTKTFCQLHRYPDQHECTFNHRAEGLASIQANNPKIVKDKIGNF